MSELWETKHPQYGPCDAMGRDGTCSACDPDDFDKHCNELRVERVRQQCEEIVGPTITRAEAEERLTVQMIQREFSPQGVGIMSQVDADDSALDAAMLRTAILDALFGGDDV